MGHAPALRAADGLARTRPTRPCWRDEALIAQARERMQMHVVAVGVGPLDPLGGRNISRSAFGRRRRFTNHREGSWGMRPRRSAICSLARSTALEALGIDRLQQIIQRFGLERPERVLLMRREEDDVEVAWLAGGRQHREAVHVRHLHVEKHRSGANFPWRRSPPDPKPPHGSRRSRSRSRKRRTFRRAGGSSSTISTRIMSGTARSR